jgi:hypothetical protein
MSTDLEITETIIVGEAEYNALVARDKARQVEIDKLTWQVRQLQTALKREQQDHQEEYRLLLQRVTGR